MRLALCVPCLVAGLLLGAPARTAQAVDPKVKKWVEVFEDRKNAHDPFEQDKREKAIRELGKIGGTDAARAILDVFEDPFIHLHDRAVSAWIQMLRGSNAADTQTFLSNRALKHRNPAVRAGAAVALGITGGPELETILRTAAKSERDGSVMAELARAAAGLRGEPKLAGAFTKALKHKDGYAVLYAAEAVARYDGADGAKPLIAALKHRSPIARAGAIYALQKVDALPADKLDVLFKDKHHAPLMALAESLEFRTKATPCPGAGITTLERLLAHSSWRVRVAAVQGALRLWAKEIVDPLIARLGVEEGRVKEDVRRALETYTGQAIGDDPELWTAWWRQKRKEFDAGERPKPDHAGNIRFRDAAAQPGGGSKTVAFYKMPLLSRHLAFIFDLSGSFRYAARKSDKDGPTKLDVLRAEMEKTLDGLDSERYFDIVVYRYYSEYPPQTKLTRALGKMQRAAKGTVRKARDWMNRQEAKGWAAFYEPLTALFAEEVDTVVLLSDGDPSRGRYERSTRLIHEFSRINRFHRVAVNTILVGTKNTDREFMQDLAGATAGRFQEADGK